MCHGDKPSCVEETTHDLCFGNPLDRQLQKLMGNDKAKDTSPSTLGRDAAFFSHEASQNTRLVIFGTSCPVHFGYDDTKK
jgi:hypothetical protein